MKTLEQLSMGSFRGSGLWFRGSGLGIQGVGSKFTIPGAASPLCFQRLPAASAPVLGGSQAPKAGRVSTI